MEKVSKFPKEILRLLPWFSAKKPQTFRLDLSQAILCLFFLLCPSGSGGEGLLNAGVPKLSVERDAGSIRKADTTAVVREDGENGGEGGRVKGEGEKAEREGACAGLGTRPGEAIREEQASGWTPPSPPCSLQPRQGSAGAGAEGAGGSLRRPAPRPPARVTPTSPLPHAPARAPAVHSPICTARSRGTYLPLSFSPILHWVEPLAAADL